eukprot:gene7846-16054_t
MDFSLESPNLYFVVAVEAYRRKNIGTILRCAVAFGAKYLFIIGSNKFSTHGAHGAQKYIEIIHFFYWEEFQKYAQSFGWKIFGIVSSRSLQSNAIENFVFHKNPVVFILGDKNGLNQKQLSICDTLIHASFPCSAEIEAHVSYEAKVSICLHKYVIFSKAPEGLFDGEKFVFHSDPLKSMKPKSLGQITVQLEAVIDETCDTSNDDSFLTDMFES